MPIKDISPATLKEWLEKGEAIVVDVREPGEHAAEHIKDATSLPLSKISTAALPQASGKRLVFHCKAGRRGDTACRRLLTETPDLDIYHLEGGLDAWAKAGYGVQTSGRKFLPLDRQVQLTIGSLLLLGVLLGYQVHPGFFLIGAALGLGLMNAGLTGWCGLAVLMARMPWNQVSSQQGERNG